MTYSKYTYYSENINTNTTTINLPGAVSGNYGYCAYLNNGSGINSNCLNIIPRVIGFEIIYTTIGTINNGNTSNSFSNYAFLGGAGAGGFYYNTGVGNFFNFNGGHGIYIDSGCTVHNLNNFGFLAGGGGGGGAGCLVITGTSSGSSDPSTYIFEIGLTGGAGGPGGGGGGGASYGGGDGIPNGFYAGGTGGYGIIPYSGSNVSGSNATEAGGGGGSFYGAGGNSTFYNGSETNNGGSTSTPNITKLQNGGAGGSITLGTSYAIGQDGVTSSYGGGGGGASTLGAGGGGAGGGAGGNGCFYYKNPGSYRYYCAGAGGGGSGGGVGGSTQFQYISPPQYITVSQGGSGGYGIYNLGTINNLLNAQGNFKYNNYYCGPLYYYGYFPVTYSCYWYKNNSTPVYGQLYYTLAIGQIPTTSFNIVVNSNIVTYLQNLVNTSTSVTLSNVIVSDTVINFNSPTIKNLYSGQILYGSYTISTSSTSAPFSYNVTFTPVKTTGYATGALYYYGADLAQIFVQA